MLRFALLAVLLFLPLAAAYAAPGPLPVRVETGALQGAPEGDSAIAYKGVPFAAPPVGPLRWRPPQPAARWTGVRDATQFGAVCPQTPGRGVPPGATQSEDCLFLNIWAPSAAHHDAPVMVWIHGGGDENGAASQPQYDGAPFARDGIVFVSIAYRLGPLGWFAHPALTREAGPGAPLANYGLMDQIAALKWVQRNIRAFGGDPRKVTVAGESAGGENVLFLMAVPAARGLFARAIDESGGGWGPYGTLAQAEQGGARLATQAGAPAGADAAALRALPVSALLAAEQPYIGAAIDGRLVPMAPTQAFAAGAEARVPLLIGANNGEDSQLGNSDPTEVLKDYTADQVAALRRAYGPEASDDAMLGRLIFRDAYFGGPARWFAAEHASHAPTFLYAFDYVPTVLRSRRPRANHGFEMLFAFEALARAPIPLVALGGDPAETTLVHGCWTGFIEAAPTPCHVWPIYAKHADQAMHFTADGAAQAAPTPDAAAKDVLAAIALKDLSAAPR
jgi:para-nitrobenzyl esterase